MEYALAALPGGALVRVVDSRGRAVHPVFSLGCLLRACLTLLLLGAARRVDVAHVNISSHGSTLRKAAVVWVCRLGRVPVVSHLHTSSYPQFYAALPGPARRLVRRTFRAAARVIVLGSVGAATSATPLACRRTG